jgi:hypothetical protein
MVFAADKVSKVRELRTAVATASRHHERVDQSLPPPRRLAHLRHCLGMLEHRGVGLLDLQEQRVAAASGHHQRDPAASADAPDPDHLARNVVKLELLEQHAPIKLEFSKAYAKQNRSDYDELTRAVKSGRITAETGV